MEKQEHDTWSLWKQAEAGDGQKVPEEEGQSQVGQPQVSCWSKYLDTPEEAEPKEEEEENVLMDRQHFHSNNMIDRKRKRVKGWKDGGLDIGTPEQSNWSSLKPVRPSATTTRTSSLNQTRTSSLSRTSPPNKKSLGPPSVGTGPVSRWALFLSSDCQVEEEPSINGCG